MYYAGEKEDARDWLQVAHKTAGASRLVVQCNEMLDELVLCS